VNRDPAAFGGDARKPAANSISAKPAGRTGHMRQLDGLRFVAVAAVAWHHWLPRHTFGLPLWSGVHLFFVLSGFLITGILLDAKMADSQVGPGRTLRIFYARRVLRIFPLYYAVLAAASVLNVSDLRSHWFWHAAFASNYFFLFKVHGWYGLISHLWTLSVEEQFYLCWPLIILFVAVRRLPVVFGGFALVSLVYRLLARIYFANGDLHEIATLGCLDGFAIGALLAYYARVPNEGFRALLARRHLLLGLLVAVYATMNWSGQLAATAGAVSFTVLYLIYGIVIYDCSVGATGVFALVLDRRVPRYLGTISYGLYLFHNFALLPAMFTVDFLGLALPPGSAWWPVLFAFWTVALASLSWHVFEKPINGLKRKFPYSPRLNASRATAALASRPPVA
jgi:peptidoglycan/LPS O-acetylase OafA/YrhL